MNCKILLYLLFIINAGFSQNKPNIIWLVCEDQSPEFFQFMEIQPLNFQVLRL